MNTRSKIFLIVVMLCLMPGRTLWSQINGPRGSAPKVGTADKSLYKYPWAGGLNACQFGRVDLNMDGIKDLVVFDRMGDRLLTYLHDGIPGSLSYKLDISFIADLPGVNDWAIFVDYDMDGREDIFTYSDGFAGMKVYKNVSADDLQFELIVYPYLTSFQGNSYTNILVTGVDYPGINDIDGDGDLDILTFWGLGSFVQLHQNMSMEKYGHADSLDYIQTSYCWGFFAESEESNEITLDTCIGVNCAGPGMDDNSSLLLSEGNLAPGRETERHTGSTFLLLDLDDDGVKDLVLGDVDYPNLIELINGGTIDSAHMISQDPGFPSYSNGVKLFSFPVASYLDIDFSGTSDLLVSSFDPKLNSSENFQSIWYYENTGSENLPYFELRSKDFLQHDMIDLGSGAYPVFMDYDGDGLEDLLVGNYGYYDSSYYDEWLTLYSDYTGKLALFRNTGTAGQPMFELMDNDFGAVSELGLTGVCPAYGDLDGDGDEDMLIGNEAGSLHYYENIAGAGNPAEFTLEVMNYQDIDVGEYSTPQLFDLDRDGLDDLVVGERKGNINYFRNAGTASFPEFILVTDSLGKINVTDPDVSLDGYSTPWFFQETSGEFGLVTGSEQGKIFYYTDIDNNLEGRFVESDSLFLVIDDVPVSSDRGTRSAAAITDLNQDNHLDLVAGNFSGGMEFFNGSIAPPVSQDIFERDGASGIKIFPVPTGDQLFMDLVSYDSRLFISIRVYNALGEEVIFREADGGQVITLDLSELSPGLYLYMLTATERAGEEPGIHSGKFLKK